MSKPDAIRTLQRALSVLELPDGEMGSSSDGVGRASAPYKIGYAKSAIKDALKDLGAKP